MKVTRIATSRDLTAAKLARLTEIAARLGGLRRELWDRFGSRAGVGINKLTIGYGWCPPGTEPTTPAALWKDTTADTLDDIGTHRAAAKLKVRRAIAKRTTDPAERQRLYTLLKADAWLSDPYLRRMMRKYYRRGHTSVANQIVLSQGRYRSFLRNGQAWLDVMSLERGQRIAIPLNTNRLPAGTLRLLIRDGKVEVHYCVAAEVACSTRPHGAKVLGIDLGYTEAYTDSDGERHGAGIGAILSAESDAKKAIYQGRNKLKSLADAAAAEGKLKKSARIRQANLGRQKLIRRTKRHRQHVRDLAFQAAHRVVDKAAVVVSEDLTATIKSKKKYSKNQKRRLSGWTKGVFADALDTVVLRRGAMHELVNASYTSQTDSRTGLLLGSRVGDRFHCCDGVVLDADENAAKNVLARRDDREIARYTPYTDVRRILEARTAANQTAETAQPRL
jgi:IS605 OrfB family transposase